MPNSESRSSEPSEQTSGAEIGVLEAPPVTKAHPPVLKPGGALLLRTPSEAITTENKGMESAPEGAPDNPEGHVRGMCKALASSPHMVKHGGTDMTWSGLPQSHPRRITALADLRGYVRPRFFNQPRIR